MGKWLERVKERRKKFEYSINRRGWDTLSKDIKNYKMIKFCRKFLNFNKYLNTFIKLFFNPRLNF